MKTRYVLLAVLVGALLAAPAMAQEKDGFRVGLAGVMGTKIGNTDVIYGAVDQCYFCQSPATYESDPLTFDFGSKTAWQLELGYTKGDDAFKLTYWYYKNDVNETHELLLAPQSEGQFPSPIIDFVSGDDVARVEAAASIKTHVLDLTWEHTFVRGEKARWAFILGLREWKMQGSASTVGYDWDGTALSTIHADAGRASSDAKGFGAVAGMTMSYTFSPGVWLDATVKTGYLEGKTDASLTQQINFATDVNEDGTLEAHTDVGYYPLNDQERGYTQFELDARLNVTLVQNLAAFVGYQERIFNKGLGFAFSSGRMEGGINTPVIDPSFRGWLIGAAYQF